MMTFNNSEVTTWALPEGAIARFGRGRVADMAFSPDGAHLTIATTIGIWWYELATMKPIALWENERGMVSTVSFSANGHWIAASNADGIVKVWHIDSQQCTAKIQGWHRGTSQLAFSPDSEYVAASGARYGDVYIWCTKTGRHIASFSVREPTREPMISRFPLCFSRDGTLLAYVSAQFAISVRHLETEEHIAYIVTTPRQVNALAFSPCGQFLAAAIQKRVDIGHPPEIHVWDVQQETLEMAYTAYEGDCVMPAYTREGTLRVAEVYTDKVVIWGAARQEKLDTFESPGRSQAARFSPDGKHFAIATPRKIHVWSDESSPSGVASLRGHMLTADFVSFSEKGRTLVSGYWGESGIGFWDIVQKQEKRRIPASLGERGKACALSPCEEVLVRSVGDIGQGVEVLRVGSGTRVVVLAEHKSPVTALAFSPTGEHLVSGDRCGKLYLWDVQHWEKRHALPGCAERITKVAFHPNGTKLAAAASDKSAIWDVASGEQIASLDLTLDLDVALYKGDTGEIRRRIRRNLHPSWRVSILSIAFSPCGTFIAGGGIDEIRLWDASTYAVRMLILPPRGCGRPYALAFSPCGRYLASGSWWQGTEKVSIRLWEVATGENVATFWSHPTDVQHLAFSPDGTLLASSSFDGTLLLWDMKPYL